MRRSLALLVLLVVSCGSSSSEGLAPGDGGSSPRTENDGGVPTAAPVPLATGLNQPCLIAADDAGPVWLDKDGVHTTGSKTLATIKTANLGGGLALTASDAILMGQLDATVTALVKVPRAGGAPVMIRDRKNFPTGLNPGPLVVVGSELFAASSSSPGPIYRLPLDGSSFKEVANTTLPQGIAVANNALYVVTSASPNDSTRSTGTVLRIALDTQQRQTLDEGFFPGREIVTDGTETFYTTGLDVNRHPKPANGSRNVASAKTSGGLAMDASYVYYGVEGKLVRLARSGGQPVTLAETTACSIALAKNTIYWTVAAEGAVYSLALP